MVHAISSLALLCHLTAAFTLPQWARHQHGAVPHEVTVSSESTIYQFAANGTSLENIAARPDGRLLVTRSDAPELWQVDPSTDEAELVHSFAGNASGLSGVARAGPDSYVVISGYTTGAEAADGFQGKVWYVSPGAKSGATAPEVALVASLPDAQFLNDIEPLDARRGLFLLSDSALGLVYRLDIRSGEVAVAIEDDSMKPPSGAALPIGINGLAVRGSYLYYSNTFAGTLHRIPIDTEDGTATGKSQVVASEVPIDDFVFGPDGYVYGAGNGAKNVVRVDTGSGKVTVISGGPDSTTLIGDTSVAFGTTRKEAGTLYVTTSGTVYTAEGPQFLAPASVVALKLDGLSHGWGY